jgi:hypothetical protein
MSQDNSKEQAGKKIFLTNILSNFHYPNIHTIFT